MTTESHAQNAISNNLDLYRGHTNSQNIIYKNILLDKEKIIASEIVQNTNQPENIAKRAEKSTQNTEVSAKNCAETADIWQIYLAYAENALANLAAQNIYANCAESTETTELPGQNICADKTATVFEMNDELKTQLDRMENMMNDIYCCSQKLYESLLAYCNNYTK